MEKWTFPLPPESISNPGLKLGVRFSSGLAGGGSRKEEERPAQAVRRLAPQAAGSGVCALPRRHFCSALQAPGRGGAAVRTRGRGGGGAGGGLRHRPPPPRPAPSGHCRISIVPRYNFAEAQRDPGARRRKYSPCWLAALAGGGGGGAGARGAARGSRRRGAMRRAAPAAWGPGATCRAA